MKKKIGFIGLGNMGLPIALNLCKNNFEVLVCSSNWESAEKDHRGSWAGCCREFSSHGKNL
ncbi:MAG: NAD(P)-binding domain-containing protein [Lachnospiraceae bacterium]